MRSAPLAVLGLCLGLGWAACSAETWDPSPPLPRNDVGAEAPFTKPGNGAAKDSSRLSCIDRRGQAEIDVSSAIAEADLGCSTDADCVTFAPVTDCFAMCPQLVAARNLEEVQAATRAADERWCTVFQEQCGAPEQPPACDGMRAQCVAGRCASPTTD